MFIGMATVVQQIDASYNSHTGSAQLHESGALHIIKAATRSDVNSGQMSKASTEILGSSQHTPLSNITNYHINGT
jgi:hypothetical protein